MAHRKLTLTTPEKQTTNSGTISYGEVRVKHTTDDKMAHSFWAVWCLGRTVDGKFEISRSGEIRWRDPDYTTNVVGKNDTKIEDSVLQQLIDDGLVGSGSKSNA